MSISLGQIPKFRSLGGYKFDADLARLAVLSGTIPGTAFRDGISAASELV